MASLIRKKLNKKPKDGSPHWSVRSATADSGISKSSVHRYFELFSVKPHRTESFKPSTDAFVIWKRRDVVGLYLHPPENALVLSVDDKEPMSGARAYPADAAHRVGICRRGHSRLQAARHNDSVCGAGCHGGTVIAQCNPDHRHQEFLGFLRTIEANVPKQLDIHLIMDNYSTHKHARVKAWLTARSLAYPFHSDLSVPVETLIVVMRVLLMRRAALAIHPA